MTLKPPNLPFPHKVIEKTESGRIKLGIWDGKKWEYEVFEDMDEFAKYCEGDDE